MSNSSPTLRGRSNSKTEEHKVIPTLIKTVAALMFKNHAYVTIEQYMHLIVFSPYFARHFSILNF